MEPYSMVSLLGASENGGQNSKCRYILGLRGAILYLVLSLYLLGKLPLLRASDPMETSKYPFSIS